eukprot:TRINITY_DN8271_c0_g2_i1.p1 TRINITY_DN8271_c0_g2~~TRINITY_DN8271_c0_g2_i1.p1  ORF type:complete len:208 (-),score=56.43 TRINITY_DN8271_c0_g2_i1:285-908(-)
MFARQKDPREVSRTARNEMGRATRGVEREVQKLQAEEKKLMAEIKRTAKAGDTASARLLAKELVRLRGQIARMNGATATMKGLATRAQTAQGTAALAGAVKSSTHVMTSVNAQMDPVAQVRMMQDFQKQSAKMDMAADMMSESMDNALDDDGTEEDADDLTSQVLDEIGIDVDMQMLSPPTHAGKAAVGTASSSRVASSRPAYLQEK